MGVNPHAVTVGSSRRLLFTAGTLVVVVVMIVAVMGRLTRTARPAAPAVDQGRPGPVLLVPGYGGGTGALEVLAQRLRTAGREAVVVPLPGDGTGDLRLDAKALAAAADAAIAAGAASVDVVGYSAGGVTARLWAAGGGARQARRIVTLGSPHHGTKVAALAATFAPGACPEACQQLVPGSGLLDHLAETPDGPSWLSLWTTGDETVTPPTSARLDGATDLALQDLCPAARVSHSDLPRAPEVLGVVLAALTGPRLVLPARCPSS